MGLTREGIFYNGELCDICKKFMHKALIPIQDFYGTDEFHCLNCWNIKLSDYDRLMKDVPKNFKDQASEKQIKQIRILLKKERSKNDQTTNK